MHMWRLEVDNRCPFQLLAILFCETGSLAQPRAQLTCQAGLLTGSRNSCLCLLYAVLRNHTQHAMLLVWILGIEISFSGLCDKCFTD